MKIRVSIVLDSKFISDYNGNIITKEITTDNSPEEYLTILYKLLCNDSKFIAIGDAIFNKNYIVNIHAYEVVPSYNPGYTGARPVYER